MTTSAADFLDQWFETDVLKATMSASGIIGTFLGIRSPGTAYVLLHHYMGEIDGAFRSWGFSRGGTVAISNAIADAAREAGVEIRTQAPIAKILVKNGRTCGVALQSGRNIRQRRLFECRPASHLREVSRTQRVAFGFSRWRPPLQIPRLFRQSESCARRAARFQECLPGPGLIFVEQFPFHPASNTWSALTTTRNTGIFRAGLTLIWSSPASPIQASRLRAST